MNPPLWPLALYFGFVLIIVGSMLGFSWLLGERHREHSTGQPFEAGIVSSGSTRTRFGARFYLVAMFFLIFDLEAVFLYAWAVAARSLGWAGYFEALIFIGILLAGLVYIWRTGLLNAVSSGSGKL